MLSSREKQLVRDSWRLVVPIKETAADLFYRRLFELKPDYKAYFGDDLVSQKRKLIVMLSFIVNSLDFPESAWCEDISEADDLFLVVLALGRRHSELYRIPDESYDVVGDALLWTLDYGLGDAFKPGVRAAWKRVYEVVAHTMKLGGAALEMGTPVAVPESEVM